MDELYSDHHIKQMHSNGTTAYETFIAIIPSYLTTIVTMLFEAVLFRYNPDIKKWQFIIEFVILVLPIILTMTILSNCLKTILVTLVVTVANLVLLIFNIRPSKSFVTHNSFNTNFVTNARSTINILSIIAILAVDFNIFPRYFAKTESFGYSLMDVGVGLFMYSNGIVAPQTKGQKESVKKSIKSTLPLFILGTVRFIFVQKTDYNVPVSEYGVHWNFFITLGITKFVCAFILNIFKIQYIFLNAIFIIILHEMILQTDLQEFILMNTERDNFIAANKEGLASSLGYISIYLFSVCFGYCLYLTDKPKSIISTNLTFFTYSLVTLLISLILQNYFGISRKLANSSYCFWILFIGIFMTGLYYLSQNSLEFLYRNRVQGAYSPLIFEAINYNGLLFFLSGNLLTGFINLTFNTLTIGDYPSLTILILYMGINCLTVTLFYFKQYKFKL